MDDRLLSLLRALRQHHDGTLLDPDSLALRVRFVLDPSSGEPIMPLPQRILCASHCVLALPDDGLDNPDCLQLTVQPVEIDPLREAASDRWLGAFGDAPHASWARLRVQSLRHLDEVIDGDLVRLANPLAREEGALCKRCNARPDALARTLVRMLNVASPSPRAVGVDAFGVDVRQTFGISRLDFDTLVSTREEAELAIDRMLA